MAFEKMLMIVLVLLLLGHRCLGLRPGVRL
jgi:hypothetical protein